MFFYLRCFISSNGFLLIQKKSDSFYGEQSINSRCYLATVTQICDSSSHGRVHPYTPFGESITSATTFSIEFILFFVDKSHHRILKESFQ